MQAKHLIVLIAFVSLAFLLSACSSSPNTPKSTPNKNQSSEEQSPSQQESGESLFQKSCAQCHAGNAKGLPGLGPNLPDSEFVQSLTDKELLAFIIKGRPVNDPANTTGIPMPPRGANPRLTDADILSIIAWIRALKES